MEDQLMPGTHILPAGLFYLPRGDQPPGIGQQHHLQEDLGIIGSPAALIIAVFALKNGKSCIWPWLIPKKSLAKNSIKQLFIKDYNLLCDVLAWIDENQHQDKIDQNETFFDNPSSYHQIGEGPVNIAQVGPRGANGFW
jgi:hypothetical protein